MTKAKYIIIGSGVSGLITANKLLQAGESDFLILESRDRTGGRVYTDNGIDLGATWFQKHHVYLTQLLKELNIPSYNQYSKGKSVLVYNSMAPAHYFETDNSAPSAQRIMGGSYSLINALAEKVKDKILLNTKVLELTDKEENIEIATTNGIFVATKVVTTIPPKLATAIKYVPELPENIQKVMQKTHTWMSNAIKVGITFKTPFWRNKNLSGTVIGQIGPVIELYDHSNAQNTEYSLMGFVNEGLRGISPEKRKSRILTYLETYLGEEIKNYTTYLEKDWSKDRSTSCEHLNSVYMSPEYGNALFNMNYFNNKLLFSGTETATHYGGYLEGAVYSGLNTAKKLISLVDQQKIKLE
ncbi:FAD-dependent oxidoreductase [uncultured Maribacter sp.]|uniref:flavin monoamine oxidase family protein n=1 Tax=uncultured Maribacter sp. TaxID=431308 RepID=UPI002626A1AE|nr:FAD-dependent oxidoreductase [uncultured Maribacter sp.]